MAKVLVATEKPFAKVAADGIRKIFDEAGYDCVFLEKYSSQDDFIAAAAAVDAIIIRSDKADKAVIDNGKDLKIIVRAGAGYDNVDLAAATAKNIVVMNTPGQNSNAVAELALGMMVYQARNQFNGTSGSELLGKTLGIHAYGNVGKNIARIAKGFGMQVIAYDPFVSKDTMEADGVQYIDSVKELYSKSQYLSVNIPANDKTKKSINYELMMQMPANATLVNTARKEVICEDGLKKVFAERNDFKYVSDIAPDCASALAAYEGRFFFTPKKMGAQTSEANINAGLAAARQIIAYLEENNTTFKVN